jgi:hypothetical protein
MRSLVSSLQTISIQHPVWEFWNYYKTVGKSCKRSNPLSSAVKPCFSLGISHFLRVPRDFCSLHAARCVSPAALVFRVAPLKSSRLSRRALAAKHWAFAYLRVARESSSAEVLVFEGRFEWFLSVSSVPLCFQFLCTGLWRFNEIQSRREHRGEELSVTSATLCFYCSIIH